MIAFKALALAWASYLCYWWWRDNIRDRMGPGVLIVSSFCLLINLPFIIGFLLITSL